MDITENILGITPSRKMMKELRDENLTEKIMKIWYEIEGTTRRIYEYRHTQDKKEEEMKRIVIMMMKISDPQIHANIMKKKEEAEQDIGIEIEGTWRSIETIQTKDIYKILQEKRLKLKNYTPKQAHMNIKLINKKLTPKERDFWWRHTHKLISIRKIENKWRKNEDGSMMTDKCALCTINIEDRQHYEYGCKTNENWRKCVMNHINDMKGEEKYGGDDGGGVGDGGGGGGGGGGGDGGENENENDITKEKWNLNEENMDEVMMVAIAKSRWIYQKARGKVMNRNRMRMDMEVMMNSLKRAMARAGL
jgi:hypothetical protein